MADPGRGHRRRVGSGCGLDLEYDDRANPWDRNPLDLEIEKRRRWIEDLECQLAEGKLSARSNAEQKGSESSSDDGEDEDVNPFAEPHHLGQRSARAG